LQYLPRVGVLSRVKKRGAVEPPFDSIEY